MSTCYYYPFSQLGKNNLSSDIKLIEQFNKDPNSAIAASVNVMQQKSTEELQQESSIQSSELELPKESQEQQESLTHSSVLEPQKSIKIYNKRTKIITTPPVVLNISNPNKFSGLIFLCLFVILLVLILLVLMFKINYL